MLLEIGTRLNDRYVIEAVLSHEDAGAVYRATDLKTGAAVVVAEHHLLSVRSAADDEGAPAEESSPAAAATDDVRERFEQEARLLSTLDHPGIPRMIDFFDVPGQGQYLVTDYVTGHDLAGVLDRGEKLPQSLVVRIGLDLCDILEYIHGRTPPVVHRDVKPGNIRITPEGAIRLVGFGVGREQSPGEMTLGAPSISPGFSPLEQYGGDIITDQRSDIYSLGATLLALVSGRTPPPATERALARSTAADDVRRKDEGLSAVLARTTAILPRDRFQDVAEFRAALRQFLPAGQEKDLPVVPVVTPQAAKDLPAVPVVTPAAAKPSVHPVVTPAAAKEPPAPPVPPARPQSSLALPLALTAAALVLVALVIMGVMRQGAESGGRDRARDIPEGQGNSPAAPASDSAPAVAGLTPLLFPAGMPVTSLPAIRPDSIPAAGLPAGQNGEEGAAEPAASGGEPGTEAQEPPEGPMLLPVQIVPDIVVSESSVEIQWTASGLSAFAGYEVYYAHASDDPQGPAFVRSGKTIRERDRTRIRVAGLRCATEYVFKVRSIDSRGNYSDSPALRARTSPCILSDTLVVSARGDASYHSIEEALAAGGAAGAGHPRMLVLRPGRYVLDRSVTLSRSVTVSGVGPRSEVLVKYAGGPCFIVESGTATFRGMTLQSGGGRAVVVRSAADFEDCDISSMGTCVDVEGNGEVTLSRCRIHGSWESGIRLGRLCEGRLGNCTIEGNAVGIEVEASARAFVSRCQVLGSSRGSGVIVRQRAWTLLTGCDIAENVKSGVSLEGGIAEIRESRFTRNGRYGVSCGDTGGSVVIEGCTFQGNFPSDLHPACEKIRRPTQAP